MYNIAILASGSGSNAENIARRFHDKGSARVAIVMSNKTDATVHDRMAALDVDTLTFPNETWDKEPQLIIDELVRHNIDLIVLAGFLRKIHPAIVCAYRGRMVNIHPSLLPAYGGKGMYGRRVHEAVIASGETRTGATVHYVTDEMDEGEIVMQESIAVLPDDTATTLEARIHDLEFDLYPRAIESVLQHLPDKGTPGSTHV